MTKTELEALREKFFELQDKYDFVVQVLNEVKERVHPDQTVYHILDDALLRVNGTVPMKPPRSH